MACVASSNGPITTPSVSTLDKEIILDRLGKEIVQRFGLSLSTPRGNKIVSTGGGGTRSVTPQRTSTVAGQRKSLERSVVDHRMVIGTNQCTRALETNRVVTLLLVCRDIHPPTMLAHVLTYDKVPVLMLPGRSTLELGQALGIRKAAIVAFLQRATDEKDQEEIDKYHDMIDSFIEFAKSKLP